MNDYSTNGVSENGPFGFEDVDSDSGDLTDPADVSRFLEGFGDSDPFQGLDAVSFSSSDSELEVALVDGEVDRDLSHPFSEELALAALSDISQPGGRRGKKEKSLRNLDEEDFPPGVERLSFELIRANISGLFEKGRKPAFYTKAAAWLFGPARDDLSFANCCLVLGARPAVVRLRVHYEFWRRWITFAEPFPFLIDAVPDIVEGEAYIVGEEEGASLVRVAWQQPGISTMELLRLASLDGDSERFIQPLQQLEERYIMSQAGDNWYLTGRNPILRSADVAASPYRPAGNQLSWSKLF